MTAIYLYLFITFWVTIWLVDRLLKNIKFYEYVWFLEITGLELGLFRLRWTSTALNRVFYLWGNCRPRAINKWFSSGVVLTLSLILPSVYILANTIYKLSPFGPRNNVQIGSSPHSQSSQSDVASFQSLEPVLPGVNLPISDMHYYLLTLVLVSVIHEFGHAIAAVREGVKVHGCGLFILGLLPGAFVDLSTEQVLNLSPWNQLKIYCAGVWHNVTFAVMCSILLFLAPIIALPLYNYKAGAFVTYVNPNSGVAGEAGLRPGDTIISIDGLCPVTDTQSWVHCLVESLYKSVPGFCVGKDFIGKESLQGDENCCSRTSARGLCFRPSDLPSMPNQPSGQRPESKEMGAACLPVRALIMHSPSNCNITSQCIESIGAKYQCMNPIIENNETKLLQIKLSSERPDVLFYGPPQELYHSISVVDYEPKIAWLPYNLFPAFEKMLKYLITFSFAIALMNTVPCLYLDGNWICFSFVELLFAGKLTTTKRRFINRIVTLFGSSIILSCIILGFYQLFMRSSLWS